MCVKNRRLGETSRSWGFCSPTTKYGICFQRVTRESNKKDLIETTSHFDTVSRRVKGPLASNLRFGRRQIAGGDRVGEARSGVGAVAKRLVGRLPAAAKADGSATGESKGLSGGIDNFEVTFDADGAVGVDGDFCCGHLLGSPFGTTVLPCFVLQST